MSKKNEILKIYTKERLLYFMTHDQYIANIQYKIDRLFYEYETIEMGKYQNYDYYNEYTNLNHYDRLMLEAVEKKGIIRRIIDGIMKIIRAIVDKVRSFFSKNKPDPKTEVMVPKSVITKTDKLNKLKPTILKGLAILGALEVGGIAIKRFDKGPNMDPVSQDLASISKSSEHMLNNIKAIEKEEAREKKKDKVKIKSSDIIKQIKHLTGILSDVDNSIKRLQDKSFDGANLNDINNVLSSCNSYIFIVQNCVKDMMKALEGIRDNESLNNTINNSAEMQNFNKVKDTAINRAGEIRDNILKNIKPKIDDEFKAFEEHDREAKDPKGKVLYMDLKQMHSIAFDKSKYNNNPDQYEKDLKIQADKIRLALQIRDFDDNYKNHANTIIRTLMNVGKSPLNK